MIIIRRANASDLRAILDLQYRAYQSEAMLLNDFSIPPLKQNYDEIEREYLAGVFLKAVDDNTVIIGSVRAYTDQDTTFIGKLIVDPAKQGQGIGTNQLLAMERECPAARYELFTSNKSIKNIKLYERLGYKQFREQRVGADLTLIYLEKYSDQRA